ncbi:MAG: hypothetical protein ACP5R4_14750, partial [Armatimonadota bacterium]
MSRKARLVLGTLIAGVLVSTASMPVLAQRRAGMAAQRAPRGQAFVVSRAGLGFGRGLGLGYGGWWTRVTPSTPEEKAFIERITALHNELRQLVINNAPAQQIAAKRAEIHNLMVKNSQLVQALLSKAGIGIGFGYGIGPGGWWTRVTPTTPEEKAFLDQLTKLHTELRQLVISGAPAEQIIAKRTEIYNL